MKFLSVCSGIESASVAWLPFGWEPVGVSEINPFPSHLLHQRHGVGRPMFMPDPKDSDVGLKERQKRASNIKIVQSIPAQGLIPNFGDLNQFKEWPNVPSVDLLVGGTPCQSFSVVGLRGGLADPRGNLALVFLALVERTRPRWVVWENVPGVLSVDGGRAFGAFVGGLGQLGYGWAYRILDAKYFGVPQRRRRVFVVGYLGDWRRAAAVLFERQSLSGNPPPSRKEGQDVAGTLSARPGGGGLGTDFECDGGLVAGTLNANGKAAGSATQQDAENGLLVAGTLAASGAGSARPAGNANETDFLVAYSLTARGGIGRSDGYAWEGEETPTLDVTGGRSQNQQYGLREGRGVRRLMPIEAERLQGFPDNYTAIKYRGALAKDGPRYRVLGNSKAVPVIRWIGARIRAVEALISVGKK